MKNSLMLSSLAYKNFNSLRVASDKALYTYTDPFKRSFARNANKGDKCNAFDQHYKVELSDEVFNNVSQDLDVECNVCDIPDEYFQYVQKYEQKFENQYNSQLEDYRDIDQKEIEKYVSN